MHQHNYQSVEVDFDVFQLIVLQKSSFEESDNDALRRLLGLGASLSHSSQPPNGQRGSWLGQGVELPMGTRLTMTYSGSLVFTSVK